MVTALLLKVSLAIVAAAALHATLGTRASAATRHLAWTGLIVALLLLPVVTLVVPHWYIEVPGLGPASGNQRVPTSLSQADHEGPRMDLGQPDAQDRRGILTSLSQADHEGLPRMDPDQPDRAQDPRGRPLRPARDIGGIYLLGLMLLLARIAIGVVRARRLVGRAEELHEADWTALLQQCVGRLGIRTRVRLLRSSDTSMPMVVHAGGAAILLPAAADDWSADRRRAVLLHELAHVARRDCHTQGLAALACACYWPHPLVWWVARRVRAERELACDDRVLASGADAREYAEHLLEIAYALRPAAQPLLAVAMASRGQLEARLLAVLDAARKRGAPTVRSSAIAAAAATVMLVSLATVDGRIADASPHPDVTAHAAVPAGPSTPSPMSSTTGMTGLADDQQPGQRGLPASRSLALGTTGTWSIRSSDSGRVQVVFGDDRRRSFGTSLTLPVGTGVPQLLSGAGGPVQFTIRRDAGTLTFEGIVRSGVGGGTVTFAPDDAFAARLVQHGLTRPDAEQLQILALGDIGNAFFDELRNQGYAMPDLPLLLRSAEHGANAGYVREMADAGYKLGTLDPLITLRDHGVDGDYVRALGSYNLHGLPPYEVQRARDHGVNAEDLRELSRLGYRNLPLGDIIQMRDHGVSPAYINAMSDLGFRNLPMAQLVTLRDHGIDPAYVRDIAGAGLRNLTIDQLVNARNHGIDASYVRDLQNVGYTSLSLDDLVQLRNHGVDAGYVRAFRDLGYRDLDVRDLTALRNAGVSPEEARDANKRAGTRLSVEQLRRLANSGWRIGMINPAAGPVPVSTVPDHSRRRHVQPWNRPIPETNILRA